MSRKEKLIRRLMSNPVDFTIQELETLLGLAGCIRNNGGRTSGSKVEYSHPPTGLDLSIHRPHPGNELKPYVIKLVIEFMKKIGEI